MVDYMENKKYELLKDICEYYNYELSEENGKIVCHHSNDYHFEYKDIDSALEDFFDTLLETNETEEYYNSINRYTTWNKDNIDLITKTPFNIKFYQHTLSY